MPSEKSFSYFIVRTNGIKTKIETEAYRNGRYLQFCCGVLVCYIVDHYCLIIKVLFYVLQIPEGIDLDQAHFSELYKNMKARFKTSGSQAQMRQAAEFKMVPLFEYLKMKETITHQRNQIEELASRFVVMGRGGSWCLVTLSTISQFNW